VVEGGGELDRPLAQHALPNTSPDMSPTPATVNDTWPMFTSISRKCRLTDSHAPRAVIPIFL